MIGAGSVQQVIEQYTNHGWVLRRVLFSSPLSPQTLEVIGEIPLQESLIDAFWFSRRTQPDREAWELRRLSGSPFALVEVIEDGTDPDTFEAILADVELRMSSAGSGPVSH